jgi:derlin-1
MDIFFRYRYSLQLETEHFKDRYGDYVFFLTFCGLSLNLLGVAFDRASFWEGFTMCIVFLWSQMNSEAIVSFYFGMQFKAAYLPLVLAAFDLLTNQDFVGKLLGIAVGYSYHFLAVAYPSMPGGVRYLEPPQWL